MVWDNTHFRLGGLGSGEVGLEIPAGFGVLEGEGRSVGLG